MEFNVRSDTNRFVISGERVDANAVIFYNKIEQDNVCCVFLKNEITYHNLTIKYCSTTKNKSM